MAAWRDTMAACRFCRKTRRSRLWGHNRRLDNLRRHGSGDSGFLERISWFIGLYRCSCRHVDLRRHGDLLGRNRGRSSPLGRNRGIDCLRGHVHRLNNLRGHNCRYWLSAVHAEPCIPRKFRAAFRAIHACRPSLGFHFFSRPYCKPDTTGNRTKQHQARVPTRFFLPAFIPLFRATAFDYSFTIEITPKETGNHVLQPLWSRKQERGSVLSKLRKRIERKLISRRRPLGI